YAKRFRIDRYIMDKEYSACPKGAKIEKIFDRYGIVIQCEFEPSPRQRINQIELDFDQIQIRGAAAKGFKIDTKEIVKFLQLKRGSETPPDDLAAGTHPDDDDDLAGTTTSL